jgi:hypothetical protein
MSAADCVHQPAAQARARDRERGCRGRESSNSNHRRSLIEERSDVLEHWHPPERLPGRAGERVVL